MVGQRSIPARAGEPAGGSLAGGARRVYPRPCGGARRSRGSTISRRGLSPPVRGSLDHHVGGRNDGGSIPARAGEPAPCCPCSLAGTVYPRPCGGAETDASTAASSGGLSPPVRGSRDYETARSSDARSIPARAGEPCGGPPRRWTARVYPRPCGGAADHRHAGPVAQGLSPPVRGSRLRLPVNRSPIRSIPARAGEPPSARMSYSEYRVYPRPCGGAVLVAVFWLGLQGLSPPVRGSPAHRHHPTAYTRSIPARAGEPSSCPRSKRPAWVYPRPCGGAR